MNTRRQLTSRRVPSGPARHWPFAALRQLLDNAGLVSVDLADTIFPSLPAREGAPDEAVVGPPAEAGPLPLPERPDHARMMSIRLP